MSRDVINILLTSPIGNSIPRYRVISLAITQDGTQDTTTILGTASYSGQNATTSCCLLSTTYRFVSGNTYNLVLTLEPSTTQTLATQSFEITAGQVRAPETAYSQRIWVAAYSRSGSHPRRVRHPVAVDRRGGVRQPEGRGPQLKRERYCGVFPTQHHHQPPHNAADCRDASRGFDRNPRCLACL